MVASTLVKSILVYGDGERERCDSCVFVDIEVGMAVREIRLEINYIP